MRVIIFGIGNYYRKQKEKLNQFADIEIIAFTDNNSDSWNTKIDNIEIIPPDLINLLMYDKILIMSTYVAEIYEQLIDLNIEEDKIITWEQLYTESVQGKLKIFPSEDRTDNVGDKVLIISTSLDYNGGSLAAVYGAIALKDRNIFVTLMAPQGNEEFIKEAVNFGITVVISPTLPYLYENEKKFIEQYDIVLVNVFQMIICAQEICKFRPVLWWIHEPFVMYPSIIMKYPHSMDENKLQNINILAVSKKAQENFNYFLPNRINEILPYGIPDISLNKSNELKPKRKIVFAIIGSIIKLKAQEVFLKAILKIRDVDHAEFWIIGSTPDSDYCRNIKNMAEKLDSVRLTGVMTRKEIYESFSEIDVVVCTSEEEMLSIAITEAMMFGKVCISNDHTGNVEYIKHGVNGFIVPQGDVQALAEQMQWIIENYGKLDNLKLQARKTYEFFFAMEVFGKNLEGALMETKRRHEDSLEF